MYNLLCNKVIIKEKGRGRKDAWKKVLEFQKNSGILLKYISHLYLNINKGMNLRITFMFGQVEVSSWLNLQKCCATLNNGWPTYAMLYCSHPSSPLQTKSIANVDQQPGSFGGYAVVHSRFYGPAGARELQPQFQVNG